MAVDNISLAIKSNSIYGLLGPNGAGKSTLLKMITGILNPTSGKIMFEGHRWTRKDLSNIGSLIESPAIYEEFNSTRKFKSPYYFTWSS